MLLKDRKKQKGERRITINGEVWGWMRGPKAVIIIAPDRKRTVVPLSNPNITIDVETCCVCCQCPDGGTEQITTPACIADYVLKYLVTDKK